MKCENCCLKWVVNAIYLIMFIKGVSLVYTLWGSFTRDSVLSGFGIAATLAASYLWIRLDVWRDDETVKTLAGSNEVSVRDLISKRADSRAALFLLILVAAAQAFLTQYQLAFAMLLVLIPIGNTIARSMEKTQLNKFKK